MSFFDTEEAHAVMLAYAADEGGLPWRDIAELHYGRFRIS
jgi:hypothetical protein